MGLHRLTSITLGVPDVAASSAFFTDFGLDAGDDGWHATRDAGDQLQLVTAPHRRLERLGLGAGAPADVAAIADRVSSIGLGTVARQDEHEAVVVEPVTGLPVEITIAPPTDSTSEAPALNVPGSADRVDIPAASVLADAGVRPSNLTHLVYGSPDQPTTVRFFTDVLGFEISDEIPGIVAFMRCSDMHHNVAIQAAPVPLIHHIAFEMDGIDDVVRGGQHMVDIDPERHTWGLGRHAIGSNWFWYLRDPSGTFVEYTADIDRISSQDAYRPKEWSGHEFLYSFGPPTPSEFMEPPDLGELIAAAG